jgi:DnaK suppressor protein
MTKTELNKFRNILEAKQTELEQFVRNREGIAIEKSPDALDEVQHAAERELAIRNLDRESNLLRNVRGALRRIEEGRSSAPTRWLRRRLHARSAASCWPQLRPGR